MTTITTWENRHRAELREIFRREMFGFSPPKPAGLTFRAEAKGLLQKEAKMMKLEQLIAARETIATKEFPIPVKQLLAPASANSLIPCKPPKPGVITGRGPCSVFHPCRDNSSL